MTEQDELPEAQAEAIRGNTVKETEGSVRRYQLLRFEEKPGGFGDAARGGWGGEEDGRRVRH